MNTRIKAVPIRSRLFTDFRQTFPVSDVDLRKGRFHSSELRNTVQDLRVCVGEVVHNNHIVSALNQFYHRVGPDESGSSCYQNLHIFPPFILNDILN